MNIFGRWAKIARKALAKRTLAVAHPAWLSSWWIADASQGATLISAKIRIDAIGPAKISSVHVALERRLASLMWIISR